MSLLLVTNPTSTPGADSNFADLVVRDGQSYLGIGGTISTLGFLFWDASSTRPQIAKGSLIDVNGSMYLADADTAITDEGGLIDGFIYLVMIPNGGGTAVTPTFTNTAVFPFNAEKKGWYDGNDRYTGHFAEKSGANIINKAEFSDINLTEFRYAGGGKEINGALTATGNIASGTNITATGIVTAATVNAGAGNITTVTSTTVTATSVNGTTVTGGTVNATAALVPRAASILSSLNITSLGTTLIPIGVYVFWTSPANAHLQVWDGSFWQGTAAVSSAVTIFSDGANMRFINIGGGTLVVPFRKF